MSSWLRQYCVNLCWVSAKGKDTADLTSVAFKYVAFGGHFCLLLAGTETPTCGLLTCRQVLQDPSEHAMVRHEAAEALGSIAAPECLQLLQKYCRDADQIVAESCEVSVRCKFVASAAAVLSRRHLIACLADLQFNA